MLATRLSLFLSFALPFAKAAWAKVPDDLRRERLPRLAEVIAIHGDDLMFGGDHANEAITALVDALAILSLESEEHERDIDAWIRKLAIIDADDERRAAA